MPAVKEIHFENSRSVIDQLHQAAVDLLPSNKAEHATVRWILQYDSLRRDERNVDANSDDFEIRGMAGMACRVVASQLQQTLPFYFASLFHIGRLETVSEYCRGNVQSLLLPSNLDPSTQNLATLLSEKRSFKATDTMEKASVIIRSLSAAAIEQSAEQEQLASEWWTMWLRETETLRAAVTRFEGASQPGYVRSERRGDGKLLAAAVEIILICQTPSRLAQAMRQARVQFKLGLARPTDDYNGLIGMAGFLFAMAACTEHDQFELRHFERWIRDWIHEEHDRRREERERRIQPEVDIALDVLRRKCGSQNPFDEYVPLRRASTPELRALVQEHMLPNNKPSPWLASWQERLEKEYRGGSYEPLHPPPSTLHISLTWVTQVVDSTIKRHIAEPVRPTETWNEFMQRLYEEHCITSLGRGAGGANENAGKTFSIWTVDSFVSFLNTVTKQLNLYGYELRLPARVRLEMLITKATSGQSVWSPDW